MQGKPGFGPVELSKVGEAGPRYPRVGTPSLRLPFRCFPARVFLTANFLELIHL